MRETLPTQPLIAVIVIEDATDTEPLAEDRVKGGMDVIAVTFRTETAGEALERIRKAIPDMREGAETVVTADQADRAVNAGIRFGRHRG